MVKIGMLLPEERMVEPARKIIEENHLDVVYLEAAVSYTHLTLPTN